MTVNALRRHISKQRWCDRWVMRLLTYSGRQSMLFFLELHIPKLPNTLESQLQPIVNHYSLINQCLVMLCVWTAYYNCHSNSWSKWTLASVWKLHMHGYKVFWFRSDKHRAIVSSTSPSQWWDYKHWSRGPKDPRISGLGTQRLEGCVSLQHAVSYSEDNNYIANLSQCLQAQTHSYIVYIVIMYLSMLCMHLSMSYSVTRWEFD